MATAAPMRKRFRFDRNSFSPVWGILLAIVLSSGCRLKSPTIQEQQALVARNSFPSGPPPWISSSALGSNPGARLSFGNLFGSQSSIGVHQDTIPTPTRAERLVALQSQGQEQASTQPTARLDSPLERISAVCPGTERQVNDAITTVEDGEQIDKLLSLTRACPNSSDLWQWLGEAYQRTNQSVSANRCFKRARELEQT